MWSAVAFALGTAIAFWFLQSFLADDIQRRADSWLTGELGVLADVAARTPEDRLHDVVIREVAELASREAPHDADSPNAMDRAVFFLKTDPGNRLELHTGAGSGEVSLNAILKDGVGPEAPRNVSIPRFDVPFRVAKMTLPNGHHIYLGLSTRYERSVLHRLRVEFAAIWCAMILFGTLVVFVSTRRMLDRVQAISETAALIGRNNLSSRVSVSERDDEISRLSFTLNEMLDRIVASVQQLHTMSDSLAHDLRSPITSMRGRLELALMSGEASAKEEAIVSSIEELDRLATLFSTSLDVSEANADALRLHKQSIDLHATVRSLVDLYEPSFVQAGLHCVFESTEAVTVHADAALLQRTLTNLFDNELRHLSSGSTVTVRVEERTGRKILVVEDDGEGFPQELLPRLFDRYVRGPNSTGHGLGLAFVAAVVRSHNGTVAATNRSSGGASVVIELP
jgi:signal transduction histidine kinase